LHELVVGALLPSSSEVENEGMGTSIDYTIGEKKTEGEGSGPE
jgi:hypothetical protein